MMGTSEEVRPKRFNMHCIWLLVPYVTNSYFLAKKFGKDLNTARKGTIAVSKYFLWLKNSCIVY